MTDSLRVLVVYGSVRTKRQGIRAARYVVQSLESRGHTVTLVDPAETQLPMLDRMFKEYTEADAPAEMMRLAGQIRESDAIVVVTGEYNHLPPPALLNLLDHFLEEWYWRPSAIVSYSGGRLGGVRAASHLRDLLAEIGTVSIPTALAYGQVRATFGEDGTPTDEHATRLAKGFSRFADELEWYARALRAQRAQGVPRE
ncbi:MAG: NAD(P)H-dependent oxidoreductase [Bacteroidota bacterium]